MTTEEVDILNENRQRDIHSFFSLSYASYLTIPRSVLQSMPDDWQDKFVRLLEQIDTTLEVDDMPDYRVQAIDDNNKFIQDPYRNYERGRRVVPSKNK